MVCTGCSAACRCSQRHRSGHGEGRPAVCCGDPWPSACDDGYFYPAKDFTFTGSQIDCSFIPINYLEQSRWWLKGHNQVKDSIREQFFLAGIARTLGHYKKLQEDLIYFAVKLLSPSFSVLEARNAVKVCWLKALLPLKRTFPEITQAFTSFFFLVFAFPGFKILALFDSLVCSLEENMHSLVHTTQGSLSWKPSPYTLQAIHLKIGLIQVLSKGLLCWNVWYNFCVLKTKFSSVLGFKLLWLANSYKLFSDTAD